MKANKLILIAVSAGVSLLLGLRSTAEAVEASESATDTEVFHGDMLRTHDLTNRLFWCIKKMDEPGATIAVENEVLSAIRAVEVHVSTNVVDDSVGIDLINQDWVRRIVTHPNFAVFPTNAPACLSLAKYIGKVKCADFPSDLVRETMPAPIMKSLNGHPVSEERLRQLELDEIRKRERRKQLGEKCERQIRVFLANSSVKGYRRQLMSLCGRSVAGCRGVMTDQAFSVFTNEVVTASCADEQEQRVLFRELEKRTLQQFHQ